MRGLLFRLIFHDVIGHQSGPRRRCNVIGLDVWTLEFLT